MARRGDIRQPLLVAVMILGIAGLLVLAVQTILAEESPFDRQPAGLAEPQPDGRLITSSPRSDDRCGIDHAVIGRLVNPITGEELWARDLPVRTSRVIGDGDTLLVESSLDDLPSSIAAINVETGAARWQRFLEVDGTALVNFSDELVILQEPRGRVLALGLDDGQVRWEVTPPDQEGVDEQGDVRRVRAKAVRFVDGALFWESTPVGDESQWGDQGRDLVHFDVETRVTSTVVLEADAILPVMDGVVVANDGFLTLHDSRGDIRWSVATAVARRGVERITDTSTLVLRTPAESGQSGPASASQLVGFNIADGSAVWQRSLHGHAGGVNHVILTDAPDGTISAIDASDGATLWTVDSIDGLAGYAGNEAGSAFFLLQRGIVRTIELATGATPYGSLDSASRDGVSFRDRIARTSFGLASDFGDALDPSTDTWTHLDIEQLGGANKSTTVTGIALSSGLLVVSDKATPACQG